MLLLWIKEIWCGRYYTGFFIKYIFKKKTEGYILNGEINLPFIFICLRNFIIDTLRKNKRNIIIDRPLVDRIDEDTEDTEEQDKIIELNNKIITDIKKIPNWFDSRVALIYFEENHTMRSLAKATDISVAAIYESVKKVKNIIKEKYVKNSL